MDNFRKFLAVLSTAALLFTLCASTANAFRYPVDMHPDDVLRESGVTVPVSSPQPSTATYEPTTTSPPSSTASTLAPSTGRGPVPTTTPVPIPMAFINGANGVKNKLTDDKFTAPKPVLQSVDLQTSSIGELAAGLVSAARNALSATVSSVNEAAAAATASGPTARSASYSGRALTAVGLAAKLIAMFIDGLVYAFHFFALKVLPFAIHSLVGF